MPLNENQRQFVDAYLNGPNKGNATQCAIEAGYSENGAAEQGSRLLRNLNVAKEIADRVATAEAETNITRQRVMAELGRIGFSDIRRAVRFGTTVTETGEDDADGVPITRNHTEIVIASWDEIDPDTAAAISEIKQTRDGIVVKMHPKTPALVELGKHLGIATKVAHAGANGTGPVEVTISRDMTPEEAADAYRRAITLDSA